MQLAKERILSLGGREEGGKKGGGEEEGGRMKGERE